MRKLLELKGERALPHVWQRSGAGGLWMYYRLGRSDSAWSGSREWRTSGLNVSMRSDFVGGPGDRAASLFLHYPSVNRGAKYGCHQPRLPQRPSSVR
jgi:hypothetical protein